MGEESARDAVGEWTVGVVGAVEIAAVPVVCVGGGNGTITIGGHDFEGSGDRSLVQVAGGALGGAAQGITLTLSGIEAAVLELLDADEIAQAPATLWRCVFAGDGVTLLDAHVYARGRLDELFQDDEIGGDRKSTRLNSSH